MMKLSIVIPAYDEKGNIEELIKRFYVVLDKLNFEFILIIQGNDGAYESLLRMNKKELNIFYYPAPLGVGIAFKEGFSRISKDCTHVLTLDADLNHLPEELDRFINSMNNADIIIGSRKIEGGKILKNQKYPKWKTVISRFTNALFIYLYKLGIKDVTSGYRLYKREVIEKVRDSITSKNFEVYPEILLLAKKQGFTFKEVPITFCARKYGESKLNFFISGLGYIRIIFRR